MQLEFELAAPGPPTVGKRVVVTWPIPKADYNRIEGRWPTFEVTGTVVGFGSFEHMPLIRVRPDERHPWLPYWQDEYFSVHPHVVRLA
jgi:hypothetical protein